MNKDPNKLFKALAKLKAVRSNVNEKSHYIHERYVDHYNETVSEIEDELEDDLDTFYVPNSEINPKVTSVSPNTGKRYSSDKWTQTQYLLTKVDSLINYMEMLLATKEPKKPFGFTG